MQYLILCKHCGRILMKTTNSVVGVLNIEIKCPKCRELLKMPEDVLIRPIKKKKKARLSKKLLTKRITLLPHKP